MAEVRELAVESTCCLAIGGVGLLGSVEPTKVDQAPISCYLSDQPSMFRFVDSLRECSGSPAALVSGILRFRRIAEIADLVVQTITVAVIDLLWLISSEQPPDQSVLGPPLSVQLARAVKAALMLFNDAPIAGARIFRVPTRRDVFGSVLDTILEMSGRPLKPKQCSKLFVVSEALAQIFLRWQAACGHWSLRRTGGKGGGGADTLASPALHSMGIA